VMTVNPGFGGQAYLASMESKIAAVRAMVDARGLDVDVEVDGGITLTTVAGAVVAGANVLVAGSALYRDRTGWSTPSPSCAPPPTRQPTRPADQSVASAAASLTAAGRSGTSRSTAGPSSRANTSTARSTGRPVAPATARAYAASCNR